MADEQEVRVRFTTRQAAIACGDAVLGLPSSAEPAQLCDVVNKLLSRSGSRALALEFLWAGKLVQTSLLKHAALHGASLEKVADIEYFVSAPAPSYGGAAPTENDEWLAALCGAPGGGVLAGSYGGGVYGENGATLAENAHDGAVTCVAAAGGLVATGGKDAAVRCWRASAAGPLAPCFAGDAHGHAVDSVCVAGDVVASGDWGGMVFLWRPGASGDEPAPKRARTDAAAAAGPVLTHKAHAQCVSGLAHAAGRLWTVGWDRAAKVFDLATLDPVHSANASVALTCVAHAEALGVAAAGAHDGSVRLYDARCAPAAAMARVLRNHKHQAVGAVAWSPAGDHRLASCAQDGRVNVWDVRGDAPLAALDAPDLSKCLGLAWTEAGLFVGGDDPRVHKFNV